MRWRVDADVRRLGEVGRAEGPLARAPGLHQGAAKEAGVLTLALSAGVV